MDPRADTRRKVPKKAAELALGLDGRERPSPGGCWHCIRQILTYSLPCKITIPRCRIIERFRKPSDAIWRPCCAFSGQKAGYGGPFTDVHREHCCSRRSRPKPEEH